MTKSRNKIISLTISVIAILLAITLAISIYYYPVESFSFIDTVPIKLIMIFCGLLALVFLGLFLYIFIHFPPPRRLLLIAFTIAIGSGTILNTIPIKGMNIINNDDREVAFKLEFYPNQDHDLIFIWTWIIAIVILGSYIYLAIYEKKMGHWIET